MTGKPRRSYETGHRPKFLVVVDETPECDKALYFAARRAGRVGADLLMLWVISPPDYQHWLGVGELMKAEAEAEANAHLEKAARRARDVAAIEPQRAIRTGPRAEEIVRLIEEDEDISLLVLAAGSGSEGPGPLVSYTMKVAASFPVPIAIVPGQLGDREIDALA
ncbi:universal stress protein [Alsobacter sp. SYSU M60028]|uniref:Universal stress protein n=1 Tax=Alsobacter ponti TaxID=2962936 RepID=A0ABT1LC30_9HYPH|nr:universal stress protein [Alsobacter ponti]MCP8938608.1 universal stress protein [Alsobacter ponti]